MLIRTIQTDTLFSSAYDSRSSMGYAAAEAAASAIRAVLERKETANVIFAAAPSQNEMLESLLRQDLDFPGSTPFTWTSTSALVWMTALPSAAI